MLCNQHQALESGRLQSETAMPDDALAQAAEHLRCGFCCQRLHLRLDTARSHFGTAEHLDERLHPRRLRRRGENALVARDEDVRTQICCGKGRFQREPSLQPIPVEPLLRCRVESGRLLLFCACGGALGGLSLQSLEFFRTAVRRDHRRAREVLIVVRLEPLGEHQFAGDVPRVSSLHVRRLRDGGMFAWLKGKARVSPTVSSSRR